MKLIVGLGNPGKQYEKTRHNLGFMVVEHILQDFEQVKDTTWQDATQFKSNIAEFLWQPKQGNSEKVILAKPKTYMNNSGLAVKLLAHFYKIPSEDIWVVYDDLDLPLGYMRIRLGGASAGHHGVDSILEQLGTDKFWRFRLGIGVSNQNDRTEKEFPIADHMIDKASDYVLGKFSGASWGKARELIKRGTKAVEEGLEEGLESAMRRYNTK